ncbi:maleylacetate reductase [Bosea sp. (in: a-proteobacteria)]|uniref:maleylacetate reductase n=1 Tax=Bosea sp. (in: a-proteobacteria) TaxID=1871050 RepID=UPI002FC7001C
MHGFVYQASPARIVFGSGTLKRLPAEAEKLGLRRLLVLTTPGQAGQGRAVAELLGPAAAGVFAGAVMHTPVSVTRKALAIAGELEADGLVAIGGGSTTGLGKAIALRTGLPQIVLPTTYAGSEMTPILGETADGVKKTQSSAKILPGTVIYDVELTLSLPPAISAVSGVNAIAHAAEALYARDGNPIVALMAEEGIRALGRALPQIVEAPQDRSARSDALYGAWLCGMCLGAVGMALHHKLCHTLGGSFDLPHAETHTIVLPHALAYNAPAAPQAMARIAAALGSDDALAGLDDLLERLQVKRGLKQVGMPADGIDRAADLAIANPYWNPRVVERAPLREVIRRAYAGEPPRADL